MTEIDYEQLEHHQVSEKIVGALCDKIQTNEKSFFRNHVAYYLCVVASMMRASVRMPGKDPMPINAYAINLAPSGFGKGHSTSLMEDRVIDQFRERFVEETLPLLAETNLPKISLKRAHRKGTDPDDELERVKKEFDNHGKLLFSFDSATPAAIKQLRNMLLMSNAGSMNLQVDEIGSNLPGTMEIMALFLELFDGTVKQKLVKNTTDAIRSEEIQGITPTNMMLFGTQNALLNGGKIEEDFTHLLDQGYARRCFFGFVRPEDVDPVIMSAEEQLEQAKDVNTDTTLDEVSQLLGSLADMINVQKTILVPDDTALMMFQYKNDCIEQANKIGEHDEMRRTEMKHRFYKAMKLAGAYAFIDQTAEVTREQFGAAIKVAEESGTAFYKIMNRDRPWVKLAKYMAHNPVEVTQADLVEDLPFYPKANGPAQHMMNLAVAWGYKNNVIIKKRFSDGIEFMRGETLEETDLNKMRVSYSTDIAQNYQNDVGGWDQLYKMTQANGIHWINHHLTGGHRNEDNCLEGFNMVVLDVDEGVSLGMAKSALKDYKALYYTTKRHTEQSNRFRIILPMNFELRLDAKDYKEFMNNIYEWLPFSVDDQTGQRSRKWLSHPGHYEYTEGEMLDVLPFIPKTSKNEERKRRIQDQQSLDNLERWVLNTTGDGNRNNQLIRYAYILVDGGFDYHQIQTKVTDLNQKLPDSLPEAEVLGTVMVTVGKQIAKKAA